MLLLMSLLRHFCSLSLTRIPCNRRKHEDLALNPQNDWRWKAASDLIANRCHACCFLSSQLRCSTCWMTRLWIFPVAWLAILIDSDPKWRKPASPFPATIIPFPPSCSATPGSPRKCPTDYCKRAFTSSALATPSCPKGKPGSESRYRPLTRRKRSTGPWKPLFELARSLASFEKDLKGLGKKNTKQSVCAKN